MRTIDTTIAVGGQCRSILGLHKNLSLWSKSWQNALLKEHDLIWREPKVVL